MSESSRIETITEASAYLRELAKRSAQVYATLPTCRAIMLTGSAAEGISDYASDLDIILYYDELPSEETLLAALEKNGGSNRRPLGERTETDFGEQYTIRGVECQFGHTTIASWEAGVASVFQELDVKTPMQKALGGMQDAIPLHGEALIRKWQAELREYPDTLRDAMVQQHLAFFPLWGLHERIEPRDATIWVHQVLVENAQNLLALLAGLNRLYFSTFQFKRMQRFVNKMEIAPANFAERLEAVFHTGAADASQKLEGLVDETLALVAQHMPHIDITRAHSRIGWRHRAWQIQDLDSEMG
jgi:hypothetical protein